MNHSTATTESVVNGVTIPSSASSEPRSELREMARLLNLCFAGIQL